MTGREMIKMQGEFRRIRTIRNSSQSPGLSVMTRNTETRFNKQSLRDRKRITGTQDHRFVHLLSG